MGNSDPRERLHISPYMGCHRPLGARYAASLSPKPGSVVFQTVDQTDHRFRWRRQPVQTLNIDRDLTGISAAAVMGIDPTCGAKIVFGNAFVPLIQRKLLLALCHLKVGFRHRLHDDAFLPAQRAVTPVKIRCRVTVDQKSYRPTVAAS